ncbi:MAG: response regulator [Deltaproteobacteria bacterium]|nr:response regulator [Deltaproteobacteria bacterium]
MEPEDRRLPIDSQVESGGANLEGMSVLLVDDDVGCVESLARLLGRSGCRLLKSYSVREAMNLINFDTPDCIISDARMPEGGVELLLTAIRERCLECSLLVLSGDDDADVVEGLLIRGADRVLLKPATVSDIETWLLKVRQSKNEKLHLEEMLLKRAHG